MRYGAQGALPHGAVALVQSCRREGLERTVHDSVRLAEALAAMGSISLASLYWAARITLVRSPEEIAPFERALLAFLEGSPGSDRDEPLPAGSTPHRPQGLPEPAPATPDRRHSRLEVGIYSPVEVLRRADFADLSPAEHTEVRRLIEALRVRPARRRSRRRHAARHGRMELRRTVRGSLRSGGEPVRLAFSGRGSRDRAVVFLLDVSGSMEPYARALALLCQAAVKGLQKVEVFALGTRCTRITRELADPDVEGGMRRARLAAEDWAGGTRLGETLESFNDRWGTRGVARGATVVILSDGWDRGDPDRLAEQMARLGRVAHRIIWVNPLKAGAGYQPLARGMAAALPFVDEFVAGESVASLEELLEAMSR